MSIVRLTGYIEVPDEDLESVLQELPVHTRLTLDEEGCLVFSVLQDSNSPNKFSVYEEFVDQQAFDVHQARVKKSKWGAITSNVVRHYEMT